EAAVGVTSRAQALIVFEGRTDKRLAVMTGDFVPSPTLFLRTPFRLLGENAGAAGTTQTGYYWKISYNRFSLDRQEDPETGGIGPASPTYNYGTEVTGQFLAAAPVFAVQSLRPDGSVPWRGEVGIGAGYLSLDGDVALEDPAGGPAMIIQDLDYSGPAVFVFVAGQHNWKALLLGFQMGIMATSSRPYSFSQSFVSLDVGFRKLF
ncbi:MAG: hypothetical protein JSV00_00230, partial [bacterium]